MFYFRSKIARQFRLLLALVIANVVLIHLVSNPLTIAHAHHEFNHVDGEGTCLDTQSWNPNAHALTQVYFKFTNGDHKLKDIGVLRGSSAISANFRDYNCDDPFHYSFTYEPVPGPLRFEQVQGTCLGECVLDLTPPPNHTFLLRGFSFSFVNGDRNIRRIALFPTSMNTLLTIIMEDRNVDSDDQFDYRIQYVWAPNNGRYSWQNQTVLHYGLGQCMLRPTNRQALLMGFDFGYWYAGTDHYLKQLSLVFTGQLTCVSFQDNDGAERVRYRVWWVDVLP